MGERELKDLLFKYIKKAIESNASDLHIEGLKNGYRVRIRVDGILEEIDRGNKEKYQSIINRSKILAQMDIAERRLPQDGSFSLNLNDSDIDLRVSIIPTINGEKLAIRILDNQKIPLDFEKLGIRKNNHKTIKKLINKKNGLIILTGPTGSGKTTTLYTALKELNNIEKHIITLEDPVEYRLDNINQIQINEKIDLSFAKSLRSVLRQDPEIIMVGEIRDRETAEISVRASITGHLVTSTLHTRDSHRGIIRLNDMGIEPYLICASLSAIISQRLVRKLCSNCKVDRSIDKSLALMFEKYNIENHGKEYLPGKCDNCRSGYKGRMAIIEILEMDDNLREAIINDLDIDNLRKASKGFESMFVDGLRKVADGETTAVEVFDVLAE